VNARGGSSGALGDMHFPTLPVCANCGGRCRFGVRCRNCDGPLVPEPLMPQGYIHANGVPLCPGHSTVSSDGSNSARPGSPTANDRSGGAS
jgi:hypothetical protein